MFENCTRDMLEIQNKGFVLQMKDNSSGNSSPGGVTPLHLLQNREQRTSSVIK